MVLNNCTSGSEPGLVAGVQDLHRDYGGRALAFNALVPLQDTTLLVVQGSHRSDEPPLLPEVCRLPLPCGTLLFFDGFLAHAGDQGVHGQKHPRLHFYVQREGVRDEVHFVTPEEMLPPTFVVDDE
jgi:ectoine hydroxylase-related dioxygenase (phytanoyl-CoA dioxygenase family)